MSSVKNERLKFNEYMKSDEIQYITYAYIESLITKQMYMQIINKILQQNKIKWHTLLMLIFNL